MNNAFAFSSSFPDRTVNSIYYDTLDYTAYNDNLLGISNRIKYRVRWYGMDKSWIENPILEKKIKRNILGTKEYTKLKAFDLCLGAPNILPFTQLNLEAMVLIQYDRTYLESFDHKIRATIDRNLRYSPFSNNKELITSINDDAIILEIKFDESHYEHAMDCLQTIPYRMTKNSKYVSGMKFFLQ